MLFINHIKKRNNEQCFYKKKHNYFEYLNEIEIFGYRIPLNQKKKKLLPILLICTLVLLI